MPLYKSLKAEKQLGIIMSHKTGTLIVENKFREELEADYKAAGRPTDTDTFEIDLLTKVGEALGGVDVGGIEASIPPSFPRGPQPVPDIRVAMAAELARGGTRFERDARKKDMKVLENLIQTNDTNPNPLTHLEPFNALKIHKLRKDINQKTKEHDTLLVHPSQKSILHAEVKAVDISKNTSPPINSALAQLRGGLEELRRLHGFVLDQDWQYIGIIALPNIKDSEKALVCRKINICSTCEKYVLVGDMDTKIPDLINA